MMNYNEFMNTMRKELARKLGSSYEITLNRVEKINVTKTALTVSEPDGYIAQNIYLEEFYQQYQNGRTLSSIIDVLTDLVSSKPSKDIAEIGSSLTNFESVKDKIVFKIINTSKNQALLADVPSKSLFNLSIVLYCVLDITEEGTASFLIHKNHLDIWKTTFENLLKLAFINTQRIFPLDIKGIQETMFSIVTDSTSPNSDVDELDEDMMYVVSNYDRINGFSCILYPNLLETFASRFGDFYILPSSLHEALFVPDTGHDKSELLSMVKEVNATQVSPEDFLADSVYFYNSVTKQIEM